MEPISSPPAGSPLLLPIFDNTPCSPPPQLYGEEFKDLNDFKAPGDEDLEPFLAYWKNCSPSDVKGVKEEANGKRKEIESETDRSKKSKTTTPLVNGVQPSPDKLQQILEMGRRIGELATFYKQCFPSSTIPVLDRSEIASEDQEIEIYLKRLPEIFATVVIETTNHLEATESKESRLQARVDQLDTENKRMAAELQLLHAFISQNVTYPSS